LRPANNWFRRRKRVGQQTRGNICNAPAQLWIAAQAVARILVNVEKIGCDLMTLSAHKLGAPAGAGALYVRDKALLAAQMLGGPQEGGLRAGTPNLIGAICFGAAAEAARANVESEGVRLRALIARLYDGLKATIPGLQRNGSLVASIPNTLNLTFPHTLGETLLIALDLEGLRLSMGSACAAGAVEPSHVLLAIGLTEAQARSSIRTSLGWATSQEEIDRAIEIVPRVWRRVAQLPPSRANRGALSTLSGAGQ